jgi:hypothetical protein
MVPQASSAAAEAEDAKKWRRVSMGILLYSGRTAPPAARQNQPRRGRFQLARLAKVFPVCETAINEIFR